MPGFLMFEEFGLDPDMPMAGLAKAALRMVPMSWLVHGVLGEYNLDIDPIAMLRGDDADLANFGEAYKGWIAVASISHTIPGASSRDRDAEDDGVSAVDGQSSDLDNTGGNGTSPPRIKTAMKDRRKITNRGSLTVTAEIDASLPKLIKGALDTGDDGKLGGKTYDVADVHMCTTAQVDVSQLTLGNNSPAAALIQTLAAFMLFNIVPYLSISMRKVKIDNIALNLQGDATTPTVDLELTFEKAIWTYYIINGSNMNLLNASAEYDFTERKTPDAGFSLGSMLNPFG